MKISRSGMGSVGGGGRSPASMRRSESADRPVSRPSNDPFMCHGVPGMVTFRGSAQAARIRGSLSLVSSPKSWRRPRSPPITVVPSGLPRSSE